MRVALATCAAYPELHEDDQALRPALERLGIDSSPVVWSSPIDWARYDVCVIRSTWDYTADQPAFVRWAASVPVPLHNPAPTVRWNSHKGYLLELEQRGVPIVPTALVPADTRVVLAELAAARGWGEVVVKPCVSAGARDTIRVDARHAGAADALLPSLRDRDLLVQPYQLDVERGGERSLIFIDGAFSHAIVKKPALVGRPFQGGELTAAAAPDELALAALVLATPPTPLFYARVDLLRDEHGRPQLMELEAIEPRLFFAQHPPAVDRFAAGVARLLQLSQSK